MGTLSSIMCVSLLSHPLLLIFNKYQASPYHYSNNIVKCTARQRKHGQLNGFSLIKHFALSFSDLSFSFAP